MKKTKITKNYILFGVVKATGWYGQDLWARIETEVTGKEFKELKKVKFLVDYLDHGVQSVDYVDFVVTPKIIKKDKKGNKIIKYLDSKRFFETHGKLTDEESKTLNQLFLTLPVYKVEIML